MLTHNSETTPKNKLHDFPDTDSFSNSFTSSSSDTSILPSQSSDASLFSGEGTDAGSETSRSQGRVCRVLDEQPTPELTKSLSKPTSRSETDKSKLQYLRERRMSSLLGLKNVQHSAAIVEEEFVGQPSRVAGTQAKDNTLWHQTYEAIVQHDHGTGNSPILPVGSTQVLLEKGRPPQPLLDSVALPSTSAWIVSQSQVDKQRTSTTATDPTLLASMPGMHNAAQQHTFHDPDATSVVRCLPFRPKPAYVHCGRNTKERRLLLDQGHAKTDSSVLFQVVEQEPHHQQPPAFMRARMELEDMLKRIELHFQVPCCYLCVTRQFRQVITGWAAKLSCLFEHIMQHNPVLCGGCFLF